MKRRKESKRPWRLVLTFSHKAANRSTVRRAYREYREEMRIPYRCDNPRCRFHTEEMKWNGEYLPVILDHVDGVKFDNRPAYLRYLCPNCDAQLETRGGRNKGRVVVRESGFTIKKADDSSRTSMLVPMNAILVKEQPPKA